MLLTKKECVDIQNGLHKIYELVDYETKDSFSGRERIKLCFVDNETGKTYEGIFETGEKVTKTSFEFKEILKNDSNSSS